MKKIFYSIMTFALLTACSNEDMMPDAPKEGPVQLASVSVGTHTRGTLINDNFVFGSGDQVQMIAMVDGLIVRNTFTYDGNKWTQDAPTGRYSTIYWQDEPTNAAYIEKFVVSMLGSDEKTYESEVYPLFGADNKGFAIKANTSYPFNITLTPSNQTRAFGSKAKGYGVITFQGE